MPLAEAEKWLDHLGSCSPCYSDFSQFRKALELRQKWTVLAIAASILVAAGIAGWAYLEKHNEALVAQTAVLDLRNRSLPRGTEPNPMEPPLELSRAVTRLNIFLPLGSSEGPYDVRMVTASGELLLFRSGIAKLDDHATSLQVVVSLSSSPPGRYILQLRRGDSEWNSFPLVLR